MKLSVIREDNTVIIDGVVRSVDLSALDPNIRAIQWDEDRGHIEFDNHREPYVRLNGVLAAPTDLAEFQWIIDAWMAASS